MAKLYDSKCYDLAEAFFDDEPELRSEARIRQLAEEIQQVIEDFFLDLQSNRKDPGSC